MNLERAQKYAEKLVEQMRPFCETVEIGGSIRRGKSEVKDIEIIAVPRWEEEWRSSLLPEQVNLLHEWSLQRQRIRWIKPGTGNIVSWQPKAEGKYWRGLIDEQIKLDLFLASPQNFGIIFAIRTGSAEFTTALVTHAKKIGLPCVEGYITRDGKRLPTPDEQTVFDLLNLEYIEPQFRRDRRDLILRD